MFAVIIFCALACGGAKPADAPEVHGLLATRVQFAGDDREKVSAVAVKLLASCSTVPLPCTEEDWERVFRRCHLHVKLAKPRTGTVNGREKVQVAEMVISFPTNTGGVWVRSGNDYTYFAKFAPRLCIELQGLLKAAKPAE